MSEALRSLTGRPIRAAVFCAALGVLVHANALGNGFAYDDIHILIENPAIQDARNLPGLLVEPYWPGEFGEELGLWRPATTLAMGLQWAAWEDLAWPYHLVNVLAHGLATALVVLLVATLASGSAAFLAGVVFAVHPVHVESVANIIGLAEIQAAVFYLAACLLHARAAPAGDAERSYGVGRAWAVTALYAGAFLTKESAVTLPGVLFLIDAARERIGVADLKGYLRARGAVLAALAAAAGTILAARLQILGSVAQPLGPLGADLLAEGVPRIWTIAGIWTHYVRLLVFPLDLSSDYSPDVLPIALGWNALNVVGVALALGVLLLAFATWRDRDLAPGSRSSRLVAFGVLWFLIAISPISNVFFLAGVLLAERTLYLPSVGAAAVAGWMLAHLLAERRRVAVAVTTAVVGLMSVRSWTRTPTWDSTGSVFEAMLRDYPQSGRSQWVIGDLFYMQGRVPEALRAYRLAIGILGGHYQLMTEVAKKLIGAEKHDAARFILHYARQQEPAWGVAPGYLAISHYQTEDWVETERYALMSLAAEPDQALMSHMLSVALAEQGRYAAAIPWREHSLANGEGGNWEPWVTLARLRLTVGDSAGALAARDSALARASTPDQVRQIGMDLTPYVPSRGPL